MLAVPPVSFSVRHIYVGPLVVTSDNSVVPGSSIYHASVGVTKTTCQKTTPACLKVKRVEGVSLLFMASLIKSKRPHL